MAFGRRRVAVSVVVVLSIFLAISLDSNIRSKVKMGKMMLVADAEVRVETDVEPSPSEVANGMIGMEASQGEVATVTPRSSVAEAPFTGDTGDTGDAGVVTTSPTPAAIVEPSPGNVATSSSLSDAFCRCSQTGGNKPPHGLESFAEEELKKLLEEMRAALRMYIYSVDFHCDKRRPKGTNRGYMVEWNFYDRARSSSMRVLDPEKANVFYIPTFTSCWRSQGTTRREGGEAAGKRIQQMLKDVTKLPFLQRYGGKKHIWISAHDMGKAEPLLAWCDAKGCSQSSMDVTEMFAKNGTALANTADDLEMQRDGKSGEYGFNSSMDVSLVCNGDMPLASRSRSVKPKRPRRYSVFFAGRWDENYIPVRFIAIRSIEQAKLQKPTSFNRKIKPEAYEQGLADSDLCLAPRGSRVWSPRLFEMIWFGCIPVIISSGYHLPASCFFDWRDFSIFIEDKDAHKAGQILRGYLDDPKRLEEMRQKVFKIRKAFMWNDQETAGDAFELAMLDVYLKQQRRC